jgi:hypothetical protein
LRRVELYGLYGADQDGFMARIIYGRGLRSWTRDVRPSDALALAAVTKAPVYAHPSLVLPCGHGPVTWRLCRRPLLAPGSRSLNFHLYRPLRCLPVLPLWRRIVVTMPIIKAIMEFFMQLFGLDDTHREMKRVFAPIAHFKPPYYRFKNNIVMPGFAQDLYLFSQALKPLMDLADRTLAHPDLRVSRRYFDYLVEADLPPAELERKESFLLRGHEAAGGKRREGGRNRKP